MNTTTTKKITKRDRFTTLLTFAEVKADPDMVKFIEHEIELLTKKNTTEKKPTAKQSANAVIKGNIVALMESDPDRLFTITELCKEVADLPEDMTPQRMSAIVRQMKDDGVVERIEEKRKAFFRLAR